MNPAVEISVNIDVPDLEAAIEFYRLALGLHLGRRLFEGSVAKMVGASSKIYLLMKPAGESASSVARLPRGYDRHWTPVHLDFVVDDVPAAVMRAEQSELEIKATLSQWLLFNYGRHVLTFLGWLLALKALSLPGERRDQSPELAA